MATYHVLSTAAVEVGGTIVHITLENASTSAQNNVPFTFGQVFSEGHLPTAGAAVELRAPDNSVVPCQMDVKTTYPSGSVKFAILSAIVPALAGSAVVKYDIVRKALAITGQPPALNEYSGLSLVMTIKDTGINLAGPTAGTVYNADFTALMAQGQFTTWLSGPICSEWLVRAPLVAADGVVHPDLHIRFNVRVYKGIQKAKIDYVVENTWVKPKVGATSGNAWESVSLSPVIYTYDLKVGGVSVDTRMSKAYHSVWLGAASNTYNGTATNVPNDSTVYTAVMTIDGVAKNISVTGSAIQNFGQLYSAINTQLGGAATCTIAEGNHGFAITSNTAGVESSVVIDGGTLYPILQAASPMNRPIQGGEYVHNTRQRWKKTIWWNSAPEIHIGHDKTYLINSKAVPNYSPELVGDTVFINDSWNAIQNNSDLGHNGIQKAGMPAQGGSPGIAILPSWTAIYVVNQGKKAKDTMLLQADLMGSWPVINREYDTDEPVNLGKWPMATRTGTGTDSKNSATGLQEILPRINQPAGIPGSRNTPDVAHHPDFCFVPYLVTGDYFYMESMVFYMMFCLLQQNPANTYRAGAKGLFYRDQTRGNAWAMRTLAHNLYLLPDNHGHRSSFTYVMASNVEWYNNNFVVPGAPLYSMFGRLREILYEGNLAVGQFQEDFYTQAIGRAIELGFEEFLPMLHYRNLNIVGRLTSGTDFCWRQATLYELHVRAVNGGPEYTSWAEAYAASKPDLVGVPCMSPEMDNAIGYGSNSMHGYPTSTEGYPANMQPAVAMCAQYDLPKAKDAWMVLDASTPKADYNTGAQFGIEPRTFLATASVETPVPIDPPTISELHMALADRVKDTSNTTGTGSFIMNNTPGANFQVLLTPPIEVGSVVPYAATHSTVQGQWENGEGTVISANTLERTRVTSSSNAGQKVNFSAGGLEVSVTLTADYLSKLAGTDNTTTDTFGNPSTTKLMLDKDGVPTSISLLDAAITFAELPLLPGGSVLDTDEIIVTRSGVDYRAPRSYLGSATPVDAQAPTLSSATASQTGTTTATGSVTTNEANGSIYCLSSTSTTATAAAVKASTLVQAVTSTGAKSFSITGLTASTQYYLHFLQRDAAGNDSTVLTTAAFTTAAVADTTAPVLTAPTGSQTGSTTATGSVSTDEASGTLYCLASTASTSTAAAVKASSFTQNVTSAGTKTINVTGLTASTVYYMHFLHKDATGNESAISTSTSFTTAAAADTTAPTLTSPTASQTGATTASGSVSTNEAGGTLYRSVTTSATTTSADIKAANLTSAVTATGAQNVTFTGLAASTQYYAHYLQTDAAGNDSTVANSVAFTTAAPTAYTVTGYSGNAVKTTLDVSGVTVYGGKKGVLAEPFTNLYWDIAPTPASAMSGWGESATVPPATVTAADNLGNSAAGGNGSYLNGLVPMSKPSSWQIKSKLWVPTGTDPTKKWYFWVLPVDGVAQCMNPSGMTATGA